MNSPQNVLSCILQPLIFFNKKKNNIVQDLSQQVSNVILHIIYNQSCVKQFVILCCYTTTDKQVTTSRTAIQECTILLKWQFIKGSRFQECKNHFTIVRIPNSTTCTLYDTDHLQQILQQITFFLLYVFFWVIPRHLSSIRRRFRTLCLFHLHGRAGMKYYFIPACL